MHILRTPLNHLLKKDVKWNWTDKCKKAFKKLKTALTSNLALMHYNPNKQIYVASNANNFDRGAVILHKEDDKLKSCIEDTTAGKNELFADRKGRFIYHICNQGIS